MSLTGPGQLYKLRFRARDVQQGTWVRIRHIQFYDAGIYVDPAYATDAYVVIGAPHGVTAPAVSAGLSLGAAPNPCRSGTVFSVGSDRGGEQSLAVYDITGRTVRSLERGSFAPGTHRVAWDARDNAGGRVPPGVYQVAFGRPDARGASGSPSSPEAREGRREGRNPAGIGILALHQGRHRRLVQRR